MKTIQIHTPTPTIQEYASDLAKTVTDPMHESIGLDMGASLKPGFWDRQLIANAKRSGLTATAKTWADGQARLAAVVVSARVEVARQGLQALVASLGAKAHAGAALIINEADKQFQEAIASQIVDFTTRYNTMLEHATAQSDPTLRNGLVKLQERSLEKFLSAISEREETFREVTKKRIMEVLK